jgi:thioredoxin-related protein
MKKLIISLFIINLFFVSCKKPTHLENPTLSVQAKSSSQVETAIKNALTKRQWAITHQGPGVFEVLYRLY